MLSTPWIATLSLLVGSSTVLSQSSASPPAGLQRRASTATGKRGLCYNTASYTQPFTDDSISWGYNWYSATDNTFNSNLEFVPMLWSNSSGLTSVWSKNAKNSIASGSTHLLGFNEPDLCGDGSSCMDVASAVTGWQTYMQPFAGQVALGSPAVTNSGAPGGLTWLSNFMDQCNNCTIDFVVVHWYATVSASWDTVAAFSYFKTFINDAIKTANGKPVWLTEFGLFGSYNQSQLTTFLQDSMTFLDASSGVARYAYFWDAIGTNYLMANATTLSTIGQLYQNYDSAVTSTVATSPATATATSTVKTATSTSKTTTKTSATTSSSVKTTTTSSSSSSSSTVTKSSTTKTSSSSTVAATSTTSAATCKTKRSSKRKRRDVNVNKNGKGKVHRRKTPSGHQRVGVVHLEHSE